jgi:hypothetical protein
MGRKITFFVESREESERAIDKGLCHSRGQCLQGKIGSDKVLRALKAIGGRISMALHKKEVKEDSALIELLQHYNQSDIEVDAWINPEPGYWTHAGNIDETRRDTYEIANRLVQKNVIIDNIGLDLEVSERLVLPKFNIIELFRNLGISQKEAADKLQKLVEDLLSQTSYGVNTYEIPFLSDNILTRQLAGIPKTPNIQSPRYQRVAMVYTTFKPFFDSAESYIRTYSTQMDRIPAIGIVSASNENPGRGEMGTYKMLSDQELQRDIGIVMEISPDQFFVFALNGHRVIERVRTAMREDA